MNITTEPPTAAARRPEIEGLRGIAILLILLYHAGLPPAFGGFIGVDLFFVISGYLIALTSFGADGNKLFGLSNFVESRCRRIFPATIFFLFIVTLIAILLYLPSELEKYGKSLFFSSTFVPNIYFWKSSGYFAPAADQVELLHLWSLGVEMQFYLMFAFLGWAGYRLLTWRAMRNILVLTLVVSFIASTFAVTWRPEAAFYLLPTRLWEFVAGSLAARVTKDPPGSSILATAGLAVLIATACVYSPSIAFPGAAALPVVVGSVLVLTCRAPQAMAVRFLSLAALRWVGKISFALYLWHWPLLVIPAKLTGTDLPAFGRMAAVTVAVLAATASTLLLERRFLGVKGMPFPFLGYAAAACALLAIAGLGLVASSGLPTRFAPEVRIADAASRSYVEVRTCGDGFAARCLPPRSAIFVWGDSHAEQWIPGIQRATRRPVVRLGGPGCVPLPDVETVHLKHGHSLSGTNIDLWQLNRCKHLNSSALSTLRTHPGSIVFLGGAWSFYSNGVEPSTREVKLLRQPGHTSTNIATTRKIVAHSLDRLMVSLAKTNLNVVLVADTPPWEDQPSNCIARSLAFGLPHERCARSNDGIKRLAWSNALLATIAVRHQTGLFVPSVHLCPGGTCLNKLGPVYIYHDSDHVTSEASRMLADRIALAMAKRVPPQK